jgi:tetratricopeptide (TPR) repeat protein
LLVATALGAGSFGGAQQAHAERAVVPRASSGPHNFWRDIAMPHADQIAQILSHVDQTLVSFDTPYVAAADSSGENRMRVLRNAFAQLRFARKLDPQSVEVLTRLGRVADDLGNTRQAIEAFEAVLAQAKDAPNVEVAGRLGSIYLRIHDLDQAVRYLRLAQDDNHTSEDRAQATISLATALALRGQMADAIDTLAAWTSGVNAYQQGYDQGLAATAFALAVFYDRDEQRGAAFEVLDKMQSAMQTGFGQTVQSALLLLRFEPPEDEAYFNALLYESQGDYSEARQAWATYAASGGAYRGRALEHIEAIDAERKAHPGAHPVMTGLQTGQGQLYPPPMHRRRP